MAQVSWRADDELVDRVRRAAAAQRRSMNDFMTLVLEAATNADLEGDEYTRIRERLMRVDLVSQLPVTVYVDEEGIARHRVRPPREAVEKARKAAGRGRSLSDYVSEDRGE
ncbi:transcriptional regulator [Kibdelosporangium aridum]|uniref:Transcriptional regulator n=1 Tax=Kibdelosporangium aridum TaxID=2030 RepID=A0A428ZFP5_KIBAR|nr:hypothetical protein [Kibdelosporangium aridum]RSM86923.1 transcriptional regulator [Kibdelosporangium aridum]